MKCLEPQDEAVQHTRAIQILLESLTPPNKVTTALWSSLSPLGLHLQIHNFKSNNITP